MREKVIDNIKSHFKLSPHENKLMNSLVVEDINLDRLNHVIDIMAEYRMQNEVLMGYLLFQFYKVRGKEAEDYIDELSPSQQKLYETFKLLRNVNTISKSGEAEDIKRMFVAICQDMRVVIIKFATIDYDLSRITLPMEEETRKFVKMVADIFSPLAESLGLSKFKSSFEENTFKLLEPVAYNELKNNALMKTDDNMRQMQIVEKKLIKILNELGIEGEIQKRQKHFYSVYKKLQKKNITLGKVYDLLAMRVLVPSVEDCYSVLGKIHAIYKPIPERVKDYIANPKPNGYQSLHTTIIADNNRPLEIQIRTFEMHRHAEYGIAAHWIYKERRKSNKFDAKFARFKEILEHADELPPEEFLATLKSDLYGESIFVQTPKGKVLELPVHSTVIDFAYAIHSEIGNKCVGGKINGKLFPITTELNNGDTVEIITNQNSKGPSRDWLKHVKTSSARSKIRSFFKSEFKEENTRIGKNIFEQALKAKNLNITKAEKEKYLNEIASSFMMETPEMLYAEIGGGTLQASSVIGRLTNLYYKEKAKEVTEKVIEVKKNKDGVLIDGDSGLLIRFAGCCSPVMGDDIIGYISRGRGVTIHRKECPNLKYLESERLISAKWEQNSGSKFLAIIKVISNDDKAGDYINNVARNLKLSLKGFSSKKVKNDLVFDIILEVNDKSEIDSAIRTFESVKGVEKVYRSE
ncbi:MAG TPA: bifunctional (p)ppGpp synthetase/guanosine-3',5'-bis(diphosphate) 3'-pyrophosphohydrolase [Candidatus Caccovivens faecavium]|nr:bifunctional (p)ppGpp synthetase/guanosine-3',5'-bis(diphosphate) 3'-pyrophosphohydrolase [Candidatus Caccovivens faecavium]